MFQIVFKVEKENNMKGKSSQKNVLQTDGIHNLTPKAPLEVPTLPQESLCNPKMNKQSPGKH